MHKQTFTQKLFRQRGFLSSLVPLLALFIGLGASQTAQAQATIADAFVTLNERGTTSDYNVVAGVVGTPNFIDRDFGTFDLSVASDVFQLTAGNLVIDENGGDPFDEGFLSVRVFQGSLANNAGATQFVNIPLVNQGLSGNIRRFSLNNIGRNLLASVVSPAGAAPGAQYRFDVRFTAIDNVNGTRLETTFRRSVFRVIGARPAPTNISSTQILVDSDGVDPKTTNVTYDASAATSAPDFQGFNFGAFDINTGQLFLNGGRVTTFESNGDQVSAVRLFYRIYKSGALTAGGFTNIALQGGGTATNGTRTFDLTTAQQNLITGLANQGIGSFFIETYFEADVARPNGTFAILRDDNNTNFYRATLSTTGIPIVTITWTGGIDDDWFTPGNWDLNRVPDANTNVIIPDFGPSVSTPYPNINSDVSYTTSRNTVKNNIGSGPALARNLALQGGSQALRSILRVIVGRLKVTGDFSNQFDSFIMRDGTTLELAGVNQEISGGSGFANVVISGGGIKNLPGSMLITESFTFDNANGGGIFTTDIAQPTRSFVELSDRASNNNNNGAQLVGETETSYIRGFVKTNRANVTANEAAPRTFGGIGLELLFTGANNPGDVLVTRNTAENYTPLGSKFSIRRIFGVRPSSPNTNSGGLTATMRFRYLDNETVNLGPGGTGVIPEPNLTIFVSTNSGGTFGLVGRDGPVDQTNNIVTRTGVRTFATFTLGDTENPLPVRLTAFDAQRLGANALITWKTATELNSKGYEVQVSTNGKDFRSLAEVASASPNSTRETEYRYIDVEKNKSGIRYYRLRQIDLDGKETFFAARSVSFEGKASEATTLAAYPNPFRNGDQVHLALQSSQGGKGQLRITDLSGRMIREEAVTLTTGLSDFAVPGMSELKAGLYMVNLTLPSGEVKKLKVAKQ